MNIPSRAWIFILLLTLVDSVAFTVVYYYIDTKMAFVAVSFFTSFGSIIYTIFTEALNRKLPLLRIEPLLAGASIGSVAMRVQCTNIGESVAIEIIGECSFQFKPSSLFLVDNGTFKISSLGVGETAVVQLVDSISTQNFESLNSYSIKVFYKSKDGEKIKEILLNGQTNDLITAMTRRILQRPI